ncbi:MAG: tyrosine-type recombinase/integrase [Syntrophaceae bacterium]
MKSRGQRKRKSFGGDKEGLEKAIKFAEDLAAELGKITKLEEAQAEPEIPLAVGEKRLVQVADEWLVMNQARWTPATNERYFGIVRDYIMRGLGKLPINKIDRAAVKKMLAELAGQKSHKTIELIHSVLSGIFSEAVEMGLIEKNPAQGLLKKLLPPKHKRIGKRPDPFSKADLDWFLEAANEMLPAPYPLIFRVLARSGMRLGECLAMRLDNLDPANNCYKVGQTVRRQQYGLPKTGERIIDIPESLTRELQSHVLSLRKEAMKTGKPVNYFFPGITQAHVQSQMRRVCLRAGLRPRTPHDLRHTYATLLLMAHISPAYVQKQLGHHSITMTVDVYGHWMPGEGKKDLEKICGDQPVTERRDIDLVSARTS